MSERSNSFNLLRLILAFLVIVSHSPELIDGDRHREPLTMLLGTFSFGEFAVRSFFILSGYLICGSWLATPKVKDYLLKRALRIYPGFLAAVAVCLVIVGPAASPDFWRDVNLQEVFTRLPLLRFSVDAFTGNAFPHLNGALWTIRYELSCYLVLGLFGVLGLLRHRYWILGLFVVSLIAQHGAGFATQFGSFFLAGVCARLFPLRFSRTALVACAIGFCGLMCWPLTAPIGLAVPWTYLLLYLGSRQLRWADWFARNDLSYGLYLYGWPIQSWLIQQGNLNPWSVAAQTTAIGLVCAGLSWFLIEKPALGLKARFDGASANTANRLPDPQKEKA